MVADEQVGKIYKMTGKWLSKERWGGGMFKDHSCYCSWRSRDEE